MSENETEREYCQRACSRHFRYSRTDSQFSGDVEWLMQQRADAVAKTKHPASEQPLSYCNACGRPWYAPRPDEVKP
jgi:hypothetical protein